MSFLAVLTLAAGLAAIRLADEWRADLAGVATVRVSPGEGDAEARVAAVTEVLRTTPGIARVRVLSDDEQAALLAPWLGDAAGMADLPAPRLIDITLDGAGPDADALQKRLDLTVRGRRLRRPRRLARAAGARRRGADAAGLRRDGAGAADGRRDDRLRGAGDAGGELPR